MRVDEVGMERWQEAQSQQWRNEAMAMQSVRHNALLPELRGARVRLRPLARDDEALLHQWSTDVSEKWLWREEAALMAFETFQAQLRRALMANEPNLIVEGLHSGLPIGWVYADYLSHEHRRCRMTIYVTPEARNFGAGAEAGVLFLDYLFGWVGLQKVCVEALALQRIAIQMAMNMGFRLEGIFSGERRLGSHRVDVVRLAMQRPRWRETLINDGDVATRYRLPHVRRLLQMNGMFFPTTDEPQQL